MMQMTWKAALWICLLTAAIPPLAVRANDPVDRAAAYRGALSQYRYDAKRPLAVQAIETKSDTVCRIVRFSYAGDGGERVPALLYLPIAASRLHCVPCLILLHGLGGDKETLAPLARFTAIHGYAALAIDEYGQGERAEQAADQSSAMGVQTMLSTGLRSTVIDVRRGLDYLATRPEINAKRIGLAGLSMGAIVAAITAGVDTRVKATVLISGGGDWGLILKSLADRNVYIAGQPMGALKSMDWDTVRVLLASVDPLTFAAHIAPRPLLLVHGRQDGIIVPDAAEALYNAAHAAPHSDVTIQWHQTAGHIPPFAVVFPDVLKWLAGKL